MPAFDPAMTYVSFTAPVASAGLFASDQPDGNPTATGGAVIVASVRSVGRDGDCTAASSNSVATGSFATRSAGSSAYMETATPIVRTSAESERMRFMNFAPNVPI